MKNKQLIYIGISITVIILVVIISNFYLKITAADRIISKALSLYGGEENLKRFNNYTSRGIILGPQRCSSVYYFKSPNKMRIEESFADGHNRIIVYNDGKINVNVDGNKLTSQEGDFKLKQQMNELISKPHVMQILLNLSNIKDKLRYLGRKIEQGNKKYLVLEQRGIPNYEYFFDEYSNLISKVIILVGKEPMVETQYSYYQKVNNLPLPFLILSYREKNMITDSVITDISFEEIDDSLFKE